MVLNYSELSERARALAATLDRRGPPGAAPFTAVFGQRTSASYLGILAALLRGHAYVPLNPAYPAARSRSMLERARCRAVVADARQAAELDELLLPAEQPLLVVFPDERDVDELAVRWPAHTVLGAHDLDPADSLQVSSATPDTPAYVLFTSGSTGSPKGVLVSHANATALVDAAVERFGIRARDRFSQTFDTTFDLSVFDLFVAWEAGACVVCPSAKTLLNPAGFIRDSDLTVWFSVPSVALFMKRFGALKPNAFPALRWSLFCGEPLPVEISAAWAEAAPNARLENLYGPTEATVFCTAYRWDPGRSPAESVNGIVPIGWPLAETAAVVADGELREVGPGDDGELLLGGPQVALGYLDDPVRTSESFVRLEGRSGRYYRTGDRVRRPAGAGPLVYLGRRDHQVKIHGHRVELAEVEAALREAGAEAAVALAWPPTATGAAGIVAFVSGTTSDPDLIRATIAEHLPGYMVPRAINVIDTLPLTANGKIDREALRRSLEAAA